jgi:pimeloyl-ACP methyl ester carboxylesterase
MCNGADPDDAAVQQHLRAIGISIRALDQLRQLGRSAFIAAPQVNTATLVLQGRHDQLVSPNSTRTLVRRFPNPPRYLEFDGGHDLVEPEGPAWPDVARHVLDFVRGLTDDVADQR